MIEAASVSFHPPAIALTALLYNRNVVLIIDRLVSFTIDSGASDVSIPADVVMTLMRLGTITSTDFLEKATSSLADGRTIPSTRFVIRKLKVGDREIEKVTGSIADVEGGLLLGQTFLNRFKSWSIDNSRQMLVLE